MCYACGVFIVFIWFVDLLFMVGFRVKVARFLLVCYLFAACLMCCRFWFWLLFGCLLGWYLWLLGFGLVWLLFSCYRLELVFGCV